MKAGKSPARLVICGKLGGKGGLTVRVLWQLGQLEAELYVIITQQYLLFMQPSFQIQKEPTLTDFSFVQFRPSHDLYEQLLSDSSEQSESACNESITEKQLTLGESVNEKTMTDLGDTEEVQPKKVSYKCNCAKSRCSKNYCQCFRAGRECSSECSCTNCSNEHAHAHKEAVRAAQTGGCNCRKTHCLKKYCECHSRGIKCTSRCNCLGCQNAEEVGEDPKENPFVVIDAYYL